MKNVTSLFLKAFVFGGLTLGGYFYFEHKAKIAEERMKVEALSFVRDVVSQQVVSGGRYPKSVKYDDLDLSIRYTIDKKFQEFIEKLLKRYPNDHTAVAIIDNNTGEIISATGIKRKGREIDHALPFTSTHPSASLFKIVTSAELLSKNKLDPSTRFNFRGRGTTLYKYQLKNKVNRWTRWITFKKAFASSNNVIFGKAAIEKTSPRSMFRKAFDFGFNRQLMKDFNIGPSRFVMPESEYQLAELASGFNKKTLMSPIHAALLSSIVANGGHFKSPRIIKTVESGDEKLYFPSVEEKVLDPESVVDLDKMMQFTVLKGTARRISRGRVGKSLSKHLLMGAKTGSITGGVPFGKRDWLTLYAKPKDKASSDKGISVAIMNVNGKRWYYKSTFLAKKILSYYLDQVSSQGKGV